MRFHKILFIILGLIIGLHSVGRADEYICKDLLKNTFKEVIQDASRSSYVALLSADLEALKTHKFPGPGPRANMVVEPAVRQIFLNTESARLFEIKEKLLSLPSRREKMIQVMPEHAEEVRSAVIEQFTLLLAELPLKNPEMFQVTGETLKNLATGVSLSLSDLKANPNAEDMIFQLSHFVNEDLLFMKKPEGTNDFVTIGGLLAIPTRISMKFVLGKSINAIHGYVSENKEEIEKFSLMINNSLARILQQPASVVRRNNFFLEDDPTLSMPRELAAKYTAPRITYKNYKGYTFLRTEHQTLRGLPQSQVVCFGILPWVYSLGQIMTDQDLALTVLKGLQAGYAGNEATAFSKKIIRYLKQDLGQ